MFLAIVIYIDNILLCGNDMATITGLKRLLDDTFSIKDLGPVKYYLELEVTRFDKGIFFQDLLLLAGLTDCKSLSFLIDPHIKLHDSEESKKLLLVSTLYRTLIGKMLYLTSSRPDISFSVQHLSQFLHAPKSQHLEAVHKVLRFLHLTKDHSLYFPAHNPLLLQGYSDSDWGGCPLSRRSVGGYAFLLGSVVIFSCFFCHKVL